MIRRRVGLTLVELLVVLAIIGVLVGLLLPAVQAAREAARRRECSNNLKQLGLAILMHEQTHRFFPTGGWGEDWVGDPNGGYSKKQPGGWIYNVLPYIEQGTLRELGKGLPAAKKRDELAKLLETPVPTLYCPSRRQAALFPYSGPKSLKNVDPPLAVAKTDYAVNSQISPPREVLSEGDLNSPLSKTVLVGEKSIASDHYEDGTSQGDTLTAYSGDSLDIRRSIQGGFGPDTEAGGTFGSAHTTGANFVLGDGSVHFVTYDSDLVELYPTTPNN